MLLKNNLETLQATLGAGCNSSNVQSSQTTQKISEGSAKEELKRIKLCGLGKRKDEIMSGN